MKKAFRPIAFLLSLTLVFGLLPKTTVAAADEKAYLILEEPGFQGGFENGTYENVAAVWEAVYYNTATGETVEERELGERLNHNDITSEDQRRSNDFSSFTRSESSTEETGSGWGSKLLEDVRNESGPRPTESEESKTADEGEWVWKPMYLAKADKDGLHRVSDYYAELTGISETGHIGAKDFSGKWGVINYLGDVIYDFESSNIRDLEGYTESRITGTPVQRKGFTFGRVEEDIANPDVVVRRDSGETRAYRNGYLVVADTKDRMDIMDENDQLLLPADFKYSVLSDVSDTGVVWAGNGSEILAVIQLSDGSEEASAEPEVEEEDPPIVPGPGYNPDNEEYIYDVPDPAEGLVLPVAELDKITDTDSAVRAVETLAKSMTGEQKASPTGIDYATLYAETASMRAASKEVSGGDILINAAAIKDLEGTAVRTITAVETAIRNNGISAERKFFKTVALLTNETAVSIRIDPDVLGTQVDSVRVETPAYALTFKLEDLEVDLTAVLTFRAEDVGAGYAPARTKAQAGKKTVVKVDFPSGKTTNPITVSAPKEKGSKTYQAVVSTEGTATASKYNPATQLMDGKISTSGSYTTKVNEKDFTDIANKSAEMQKAIRYLASKEIIKGTTETTFSPNGSISRAEVAMLLVKALGKLDSSASANFTDVSRGSWYYAAAACSQKHGFIEGFEDRTFRGGNAINRVQIVAVSSRVLEKQMGYHVPSDPSSYLSKYRDQIAFWAKPEVALATRENLVVYRKDGTFSGEKSMTRGDAAIIIYRMFQKIW